MPALLTRQAQTRRSSLSDEPLYNPPEPIPPPPAPGEPRRAMDKVTQDNANYGPAVAAQLATLNATVAALHGELYRSLNGLEKATERGFDGVGRRLDKLEDRMGGAERFNAAVEARVSALESDGAAIMVRDESDRRAVQIQRDALAEGAQKFAVWQILLGVALGLVGLVGTISAIVSALR